MKLNFKNPIMKLIQKMLLLSLIINLSCSSTKVLSPTEIKLMTTKQYEESYEMVFKSAMSLLQSEQFVIEETDFDTGLIIATKNIFQKKTATLTKGSIIIDKINEDLTEVKLTIYSGEEKTRRGYYGSKNKTKIEQMIEEPEFYNKWFNKLYAEIERRKALR